MGFENLEPPNIWIPAGDHRKIKAFVYSSYKRLESDFMDYLNFVPLRNEHLCVSSSRLADFIPRISSLLSKCFRLITFGNSMKTYCINNVTWQFNGNIENLKALYSELEEIYTKKEQNDDNLNEYYRLHDLDEPFITGFWDGNRISMQERIVKEKIGILDSLVIKPFEHKEWYAWRECRNSIEHRDRTEASLKDVLYGLAFIAITLENITKKSWLDRYPDFDSDLFVVTKIVWG